MKIAPKVFISYSWTSDEHEAWVINLATRLRKDGVDAFIDKWLLKPGHDRFAFMEQMIVSKDVHKVIVVCDKGYKEKADQRIGGVGVESQVISQHIYTKVRQEKFIPVIAERDENGDVPVPTFMSYLIYIDLSDEKRFETGYKQLLYSIFETSQFSEPELGTIPDFINEKRNDRSERASITEENKNTKETECFEPIFESDDTKHNHSICKVSLNAFLPNKYDLGSCLITFISKDISGCMFTLEGRSLIHTLFHGLGTPAKEAKRRFIVGYDEKINTYIIQFPHNRFYLNPDDTEELCKIVDSFYPYYLKAMRIYRPAESNKVVSVKDLYKWVEKIQGFYSTYNGVTSAGNVKKAYEALKLALEKSLLSDEVLGYISSKLDINNLTKNNIRLKISEYQNTLSGDFMHTWEVDMVLRSLGVLIRDCKSYLTTNEVREIIALLQSLEDMKDLFEIDESDY